jgi:hypothetical protein
VAIVAARHLAPYRFPVPLRFVTKQTLLSFDLRLDDVSLPMLTRAQNGEAAMSALHAAAELLPVRRTTALDEALRRVATEDSNYADCVLPMLGLQAVGRGTQAAGGSTEEVVQWLVRTLDTNFLLLADVSLNTLRERQVFKVSHEEDKDDVDLTLGEWLGLRSVFFVFDAPDATAAASYHFQLIAPEGLLVEGGELFTTRTVQASPPGFWRRAWAKLWSVGLPTTCEERTALGTGKAAASVIDLHLSKAELRADDETFNAEIIMRPATAGLVRSALASTSVSSLVLWVGMLLLDRLDGRQVEAATTLLLVLPGGVSTFLARPGEHVLVSQLLRGTRCLALLNGFCMFVAAATLVLGVTGDALFWWWVALAWVSVATAALLAKPVLSPHRVYMDPIQSAGTVAQAGGM